MAIDQIKPGERIVAVLPDNMNKEWREIENLNEEGYNLFMKLNEMKKTVEAMQVLFWNKVKNINECCETSLKRGKDLTLRMNSDHIVVIETKQEAPGLPDIIQKIENLRKLLGGGHEE